jgi:hypothetical protein
MDAFSKLQIFFSEKELNTIGQPGTRLANIRPNATVNNPSSYIPRTFWLPS